MNIKRNILNKENLMELENLVNRLDKAIAEAKMGRLLRKHDVKEDQPDEVGGGFNMTANLHCWTKSKKYYCGREGFVMVVKRDDFIPE